MHSQEITETSAAEPQPEPDNGSAHPVEEDPSPETTAPVPAHQVGIGRTFDEARFREVVATAISNVHAGQLLGIAANSVVGICRRLGTPTPAERERGRRSHAGPLVRSSAVCRPKAKAARRAAPTAPPTAAPAAPGLPSSQALHQEGSAIEAIAQAMEGLAEDSRRRVLLYVSAGALGLPLAAVITVRQPQP